MRSFDYNGWETFHVPARFWQDHIERACRCGDDCPDKEEHQTTAQTVGSTGGRMRNGRYVVTLNAIDANELLSDARHYSDYTSWGDPYQGIGLQSSARATVARLEAYRADIEADEEAGCS